MMEKNGQGGCSLASLRLLLLVGSLLMAGIILTWTISDKIKICTYENHIHQVDSQPPQVPSPTRASWNYDWDKRASKSDNKSLEIPSRVIVLIRHGQYHYDTGHLTEQGQKQANMTGRRLAEMNWPWDFIVHSNLDRAVETASIIHKHLPSVPMSVDQEIREGGAVVPKPTITYWGLPDTDYHKDGPRMEGAFRKIFHRPERATQKHRTHELYVAHANIFRFFVLRALQLPPEAWMRMFIAHGSMTVLHINGNGIVNMDKFGDSGYMPHNMVSY